MRPTSLIVERKPHGEWQKPWDYLLFDAAQRVDDELCQKCGLPVYICHNESNEVEFRIREDSCAATRKVDEEMTRRTKGKKEIPAGVTLSPEPFSTEGKPLAAYRDEYWVSVMERRAALEAARSPQTAAEPPEADGDDDSVA